jgi:fibronectin-binding autotransporter adhesin
MKSLHIRRIAAGLVIILLPVMAQAGVISWTNSAGSGAWEAGANWSGGVAPSNNITYLTNAVSKTVTISASTPVDNLTVSNLFIEAPVGATNTLLLSGNTNPLVCFLSDPNRSVYLGQTAGKVGSVILNGGWLVTTNGAVAVGYYGAGMMTVSNGLWQGQNVNVGDRSTGRGTLNIYGGTNLFSGGMSIGTSAGSTGSVLMAGGRLVSTNASANNQTYIGDVGVGDMTASGGTWMADTVNIANGASPNSALTLGEGTRVFKGIGVGVGAASVGALNITGGTNVLTSLGVGTTATGTGTVSMIGGLLVVTNTGGNAQFSISYGGRGDVTLSNGTWIVDAVNCGKSGGAGSSLRISGGLALAKADVGIGSGSNNTILITGGGILDTPHLMINSTGPNNVISNSGGIYQFSMGTPWTTVNGATVINGGTISFRDVSGVDVKHHENTAGYLSNITFYANNAFRLNSSSNATSPDQTYTFATGLGARNYTRLELVNATTCYQGGNVTVGVGGLILFSNTTALLKGSLSVNNTGAVSMVDSTVTITGACTIAENSIVNWTSNTLSTVINVGGVLTLPTNATLNISGSIGRNDQLTLFSAPNQAVIGAPVNWVVVPATHRVSLVGRELVLRPRSQGFVFQIQ